MNITCNLNVSSGIKRQPNITGVPKRPERKVNWFDLDFDSLIFQKKIMEDGHKIRQGQSAFLEQKIRLDVGLLPVWLWKKVYYESGKITQNRFSAPPL